MAVKTLSNKSKLVKRLNNTQTEKDVENVYRTQFLAHLPKASITSPYNTDGVLETDTLYVLLEFKYDLDFTVRADVLKPVIQSLMYLKKFYDHEDRIPSAIFVGDRNECFMLETEAVVSYLDRADVDWTAAPSSAWKELPSLYRKLIKDPNINPYVLDVRERKFYFQNVIDKLEAVSAGTVHKVPITIHNISGIYRSWEERVLREDIGAQKAVGAFIQSVLGEAYLHPRKKNTLVLGRTELSVNSDAHEAFFSWFQSEYRVSEKRNFTAIKDRLVEEESRRRSGDFYTPAVWAHEAHKMLDAELGPDWREEWVVWDCAAGTANLTRDYGFNELYLSTLFEADVETIKSMGYNPNATVFQFDFLNDVIDGDGIPSQMEIETDDGEIETINPGTGAELPPALQASLEEGKKMVFLINPPFGTAGSGEGGTAKSKKSGVATTLVRNKMGLGRCKEQLYAQFMFRITEIVEKFDLEDAVFALYSVPLFFSGSSFKKFRKYFYDRWEFKNGFLFRADEFNGTASSWGCAHTLWRKGKDARKSFDLTLKKRDEHGVVQNKGTKAFYYPEKSASKWVKAPRKMWWGKANKDVPNLSSAIEVKDGYQGQVQGSLGFFDNDSNNVMKNAQSVLLLSWPFSGKHGKAYVFPQNFRRCVALFTARKSIKSNWINQKDEYCEPNEDHPDYDQWVNDCIVYSLFHSSSQQSSLRGIDYDDKKWDIENEFFWMSNQEVQGLADEHGFVDLYNDCQQFSQDRHVYKELQKGTLSPDAKDVLDRASQLVRDSMEMRLSAHQAMPEMHLNAWDAGWYQVRKGILEEYYPKRYKAFVAKYKALENRLRKGVFTFGFLK